jgi:beta-1,4-galactosyltransferase 3
LKGYSNRFWGWGGEDDDFATRLNATGIPITRPPFHIAKFRMMHHKNQSLNRDRYRLLNKTAHTWLADGLNSLQYKVLKKQLYTGFTYFLFDVGELQLK